MKSFMAVSFQYLDDNFELVSGLLDFLNIDKHEGKRLAQVLINLFDDFGLEKSQILTLTVDNCSNNSTMMNTLIEKGYIESAEYHIKCFAHILNLAAQDLLGFISNLLNQLRNNNKFIRNSPLRLQQLEIICKMNGEVYNKPEIDSRASWSSTYSMLVVDLKMEKSMNECISRQEQDTIFEEEEGDGFDAPKVVKVKAVPLTDDEWELVKVIVSILDPINEATLFMCTEKSPSISLMMPYFDSVLDALVDVKDRFLTKIEQNKDSNTISDGSEALYKKLSKYFKVSSDFEILATVLDPRLRMDYYRNNGEADHIYIVERLVEQLEARLNLDASNLNPTLESTIPNPTLYTSRPRSYYKRLGTVQNQTTLEELQNYLKEPYSGGTEKPLEWWNLNKYYILTNRTRFPKLSKIAQAVLAIPATLAAFSENAFSSSRLAMPWNQTRVASSTLRAIMCLRDWLKLTRESFQDEDE